MKLFKMTLLASFTFISITASAQMAPSKLVPFSCTSGQAAQWFNGTLDYSHYTSGSGYAELKNVEMNDNYVNASLICESKSEPGNFGCVGFAYGSGYSQNLILVTITTNPSTHQVTLSYSQGSRSRSWQCR